MALREHLALPRVGPDEHEPTRREIPEDGGKGEDLLLLQDHGLAAVVALEAGTVHGAGTTQTCASPPSTEW